MKKTILIMLLFVPCFLFYSCDNDDPVLECMEHKVRVINTCDDYIKVTFIGQTNETTFEELIHESEDCDMVEASIAIPPDGTSYIDVFFGSCVADSSGDDGCDDFDGDAILTVLYGDIERKFEINYYEDELEINPADFNE